MGWKIVLVGLVIFSVGCALFRGGPEGRQGVRLVELAKDDLARRSRVGIEEVTLVGAEAVKWPDAFLGNPQPGMVYTQVITPDSRIILFARGQEYEYHSDQKRVVLVEHDRR